MKKKEKFEITNNMVALLAILFIVISSIGNYIVYRAGEEAPIKQLIGLATGQMRMCFNEPARINNDCNSYSYAQEQYSCFINATDREGRNISYSDNSTLFNINNNGTIEFIPLRENIGYYNIILNISDGSVCPNSVTTKAMGLYVCMEPAWDNFKNHLTTNLSNLSCWNAVENFTIGIPYKAMINFTINILKMDGYDFDQNLNLSYNYINVNVSALPSLNTSAEITLYNLSLNTTIIIWNNRVCDNNTCCITKYNNNNLTFNVSNFYGTYFVVDNVNLSIWDSTDTYTRYVNDLINFYANFTFITGETVTDETCKIRFNISGSYSSFSNMTYNSTTNLYDYERVFSIPGIHDWNVLCNISGLTINKTDTVNVSNRAPLFYGPMPNETWNEDTTLTGRDLDDYFIDPDKEDLIFTYTALEHITVVINPTTHIITLIPDSDWYGEETIIYIATDAGGLSVSSNLIVLTVIDVPEPTTPPPPTGATGGSPPPCYEDWICSDWGQCLPTGIQTRTCYDKNNCGTTLHKPEESQECEYIPTCFDNIKNGEEEGVDCGGPCPACPTCYDGIKNQREEGIDCGGPCPACPTCYDNVQNCHTLSAGVVVCEENMDCGGPCPACPTCYDGIQNQNEGGIDCGGPCPACVPLFAPLSTEGKIFFLILIIIIILVVLYLLLRKKMNALLTSIKEKAIMLLLKFKKQEEIKYKPIEEELIGRLVELEKTIDKEKTPELFEEFFYIIKGFFTNTLKIGYEFTYEELEKEMKKQKFSDVLVKGIISFYKDVEEVRFSEKLLNKEKLKEFITKAKNIVKDLILLKTIEVGERPEDQIKRLVKKALESIKKDDQLNAKINYMKALQVYKEMGEKEKAKHYHNIKNLHKHLSENKGKNKEVSEKILTIILIFASVFFLSFFIVPQKTGFVVMEDGPELTDIPDQTAPIGKLFIYKLDVDGGFGRITYLDNTDMFNISNNGLIEFIPTEKYTGSRTAVVVVEDENKNYDYQLIKFNITG